MEVELSLTVTDRLLNKIEDLSKKMQINKNDLIIKALKKFLLIQEIRQIRKILKKQVIKQGYKSEDDIFNAVS
ncbi:MAG: hypothetical protein HY958_12485 [Bacteroidia bacterium]|nr:hypothetical protein [Bacteroidia bacterium]